MIVIDPDRRHRRRRRAGSRACTPAANPRAEPPKRKWLAATRWRRAKAAIAARTWQRQGADHEGSRRARPISRSSDEGSVIFAAAVARHRAAQRFGCVRPARRACTCRQRNAELPTRPARPTPPCRSRHGRAGRTSSPRRSHDASRHARRARALSHGPRSLRHRLAAGFQPSTAASTDERRLELMVHGELDLVHSWQEAAARRSTRPSSPAC